MTEVVKTSPSAVFLSLASLSFGTSCISLDALNPEGMFSTDVLHHYETSHLLSNTLVRVHPTIIGTDHTFSEDSVSIELELESTRAGYYSVEGSLEDGSPITFSMHNNSWDFGRDRDFKEARTLILPGKPNNVEVLYHGDTTPLTPAISSDVLSSEFLKSLCEHYDRIQERFLGSD